MPRNPQHFVTTDPREFDGNPYEVATRAGLQATSLLDLTIVAVEDATVMARNAEMERQCVGGDPDAAGWDESAAGRRWAALKELLWMARNDLAVLGRVASYDPKNPPHE